MGMVVGYLTNARGKTVRKKRKRDSTELLSLENLNSFLIFILRDICVIMVTERYMMMICNRLRQYKMEVAFLL